MADSNQSVGAIWAKTSKSGRPFFSISLTIDGVKKSYVAFENTYKTEGDNRPDYQILESNPLPARQAETEDVDSDDIPF